MRKLVILFAIVCGTILVSCGSRAESSVDDTIDVDSVDNIIDVDSIVVDSIQ